MNYNELAPIILFVYKRPEHTKRILESLSKCNLSNESTLIIFADGPKENASQEDLASINEVRNIIYGIKWCKELKIIKREKNWGLDPNVIDGVTNVVNEFGKVIVLEDDLVCHPMFLEYMNFCLIKYKDNESVMGVSGFSFLNDSSISSCYFLPLMSAWSWGIWKDRWEKINFNSKELINLVKDSKLEDEFNFGGYNYSEALFALKNHKYDPWDIRVYANLFLNKQYYIFPNKTLVRNLGFDGTGVHCGNTGNMFDLPFMEFSLKNINVTLDNTIVKKVELVYKDRIQNFGRITLFNRIKNRLKKWVL